MDISTKMFITITLTLVMALLLMTACGETNQPDLSPLPESEPSVDVTPSPTPPISGESSPETTPPVDTNPIQSGETEIFSYNMYFSDDRPPFSFEVTNVACTEIVTAIDDVENPREYTAYTLYPGAMLTVINADMDDGSLSEYGGHPSSNWQIHLESGDLIHITDDMEPLEITPDMSGIIISSVFVVTFDMLDETLFNATELVEKLTLDMWEPYITLTPFTIPDYVDDNAQTRLAMRWPEYQLAVIDKHPGSRLISIDSLNIYVEPEQELESGIYFLRGRAEIRHTRADTDTSGVNGVNVQYDLVLDLTEQTPKIIGIDMVFNSYYRRMSEEIERRSDEDGLSIELVDSVVDAAIRNIQ